MKKVLFLIALLATLIPAGFVVYKAGGLDHWQGVTPRGTIDSLYYYARIHEVADGHPLVGNPYLYEHRAAFAPAFFLPDVVSAVPLFLGIHFNLAISLNFLLWSFVLLLVTFWLLRQLLLPLYWALGFTILSYLCVYSFMLRPTIMQLIFPLFAAYLLALYKFLSEPHDGWKRYFLALAAAATFYAYTFLSYVVLISLTLILFWYLLTKRFKEAKGLLLVAGYSALFLVPFAIATLAQMGDPNYFETLRRLGLVYTHLPSIEAYYYGRWVLGGLVALGLMWKILPKKNDRNPERKIFYIAIGLSLLIASVFNVLTGVEMTLAVHIGRLSVFFMTLLLAAGVYEWFETRNVSDKQTKYIPAVIILVLAFGVLRNVPRGLSFFQFNNRGTDIRELQSLAGPMKWLERNLTEESVIWSNAETAEYIPVLTKHYPLFAEGAALHFASASELEDRYLLSRSLETLTVDNLKDDFIVYAGRGPAKEEPRVQHTDAITLRGEEYFDNLLKRFEEIKKNRADLLQEFNAKYLLLDRSVDELGGLKLSDAVYDDGRYVILPLPL